MPPGQNNKPGKLYLLGAHVWAYWRAMQGFDLFYFVAYSVEADQYAFKSRKTKRLVIFTMDQLTKNHRTFRPFLIDTKLLTNKETIACL